VLDLSLSLNPFPPDVQAVVRASLGGLRRYPDERRATAALAEAMDVDPALLVLTNGAAEAIALVAGVEPVGWVEPPEFSLFEHHLALEACGPRWRSNPANPLGHLAGPDETAAVWDESFWPLATGTWTRGDAEAWRIGSLTKLWSCPGLRIGYVVAPDERRAALVRARQPRWSVGSLALAVVEHLAPRSDLSGWAAATAVQRRAVVEGLAERGLAARDSAAPWVLVVRPGLRAELAPLAVVVRDCASFGLDGTVRIAVPDHAGLDRLLAAVDRIAG
jgi:threonine-phosphate decarboxylase